MTDNAQALLAVTKLDTGMSAREAVARASVWWDRVGRHIAMKAGDQDLVMRQVSALLRGDLFDNLGREDQVKIVRIWHHFKVRREALLDTPADAPFKLGGEERVN